MAELNARIIAKASATAGETPQAADLEVAEIAVNTADGKFFTKHTDGTVKEISGSGGGGGGGGGAVNSLDDIGDVDTPNPIPGEVLAWNGVEWTSVASSGIASLGAEYSFSSTTAALSPLGGGDAILGATSASWTADGWTVFGTTNYDDGATTIPWPVGWDLVEYMGSGAVTSTQNWFINSNGGIGWDAQGGTYNGRQGNSTVHAADIDFYISFWNQDTETIYQGYKEITQNGVDYFVVRAEFKVPYSFEAGSLAVETWFGRNGDIQIKYGSLQNGSGQFNVADDRCLVLASGVPVYAGHLKYPGLTGAGDYVATYSATSASRIEPSDVVNSVNGQTGVASLGIQDMDDYLSSTSPADGEILQWDDAEQKFKPSEPPQGAVSSVNDEVGAVSLGVQDMNDYQLRVAGGPRYIFNAAAGSSVSSGDLGYFSGVMAVHYIDQDGVNWGSSWGNFPQGTSFSLRINGVETSGYAKSDSGYSTGGKTTFRVTPNFGDSLVDGDEVEFLIDTFPAPTVPLAQGDVLQWNAATEKFNPVTPIQRIQDQKDFQLTPNTSEYTGLNYRMVDGSNTTADSTPGGWFLSNTSYLTFNAVGYDTLSLLEVGDTLTLKIAGEADFVTTVSIGVTSFSASYYLQVSEVPPAAYLNAAVGTPLVMEADAFAQGSQPLVAGDILQWDADNSKFSPVQLTSVSGAVASVNGETGDVSLGIQDMDDLKAPIKVNYVWTPGAGISPPSGQIDVVGADSWALSLTDADGVSFETEIADAAAASLQDVAIEVSRSGVVLYEGTWGNFQNVNSSRATFFMDDSWISVLQAGDIITLISPGIFGDGVSLTDGDMLQWSDADQKFKTNNDHISLSALKVEVAASTDFADFQARIAAL